MLRSVIAVRVGLFPRSGSARVRLIAQRVPGECLLYAWWGSFHPGIQKVRRVCWMLTV